jgi:hypothetical protein
MTHAELVERAAAWLRKRCSVVITEMTGGTSECADAIGWKGGWSCLVECKASRADFLADSKKFFRLHPDMGMGYWRWYCAPLGLIAPEELPTGWGLIEVGKRTAETVKPAAFTEHNRQGEIGLLLSALCRIGQTTPKGVSVKAYTYETKNRATLGIEGESNG